ncbi:MAG: hypothetical protein IPN98_18095 [Propionivibrio sp.]|nr:hypothetical protein [Propionivibrio sp.]
MRKTPHNIGQEAVDANCSTSFEPDFGTPQAWVARGASKACSLLDQDQNADEAIGGEG